MGRLIYRTSHHADFVHSTDPHIKVEGAEDAPDLFWVEAKGQPKETVKWRVRPLSLAEWDEVQQEGVGADNARVVELGLVSVDGDAPPTDLAFAFVAEVAALVVRLTLDPLDGRISKSEVEASSASSDTSS